VDCGVGVALERPAVEILVEGSYELRVEGEESDFFAELCSKALDLLMVEEKARIVVRRCIPRHVGLGSGTQSALAIATSLCRLFHISREVRELARLMGRGGTSGIGVAAFQGGGLILDGGHSFGPGQEKDSLVPSHFSKAPPAPLVARYEVPGDWIFVVAIPEVPVRRYGIEELKIFEERCPISGEEVGRVSRIILVKMMPALVERDIEAFGESLSALQEAGFKKIEVELQHPVVKEAMNFMTEEGAYGAGLSSFGPTVYGLVRGEAKAKDLADSVEEFLANGPGGTAFYTRVNNTGAQFKLHE